MNNYGGGGGQGPMGPMGNPVRPQAAPMAQAMDPRMTQAQTMQRRGPMGMPQGQPTQPTLGMQRFGGPTPQNMQGGDPRMALARMLGQANMAPTPMAQTGALMGGAQPMDPRMMQYMMQLGQMMRGR